MHVLLDIGSTLIEGPKYGPSKRLARELGLDKSTLKEINDFLFMTPLKEPESMAIYLSNAFNISMDTSYKASVKLWQAQLGESFALPGAVDFINGLRSAQVSHSYISNIWAPFYHGFTQFFPHEAKYEKCYLSFELGLIKPNLNFYEHALNDLKIPASDIVMIGDTYLNDIKPALELGMETIWVLHRPEKEMVELTAVLNGSLPPPSLTVGKIGDLNINLINGIFNK